VLSSLSIAVGLLSTSQACILRFCSEPVVKRTMVASHNCARCREWAVMVHNSDYLREQAAKYREMPEQAVDPVVKRCIHSHDRRLDGQLLPP
jgi:hypothetical protein